MIRFVHYKYSCFFLLLFYAYWSTLVLYIYFYFPLCATCLPADRVLVFIIPTVYDALLFHFVRALSGWLFLLLAAYCAWRLESRNVGDKDSFQCRCVVLVQLIMVPVAIWNLVSTAQSIKDKQGLLLINQIVSWSMLGEYANWRSACGLIFSQQWSSWS